MKILLTGSQGFIGFNLNLELLSRGHEVTPYIRLAPYLSLDKIYDVIIHCAAELKDENIMVDSNVELTKKLLDFAKSINARFIYFGSSSEYGSTNLPRSEGDNCNPNTVYEVTKYIGTQLCEIYGRLGLNTCVIRPFSVYGPGEQSHKFIPKLYRLAKAGKTIEIYPGAHDWIYIDDFIDGCMRIIENPKIKGIYNLGTGISTSNKKLFFLFKEIYNKPISFFIVNKPFHHYDVERWEADTKKSFIDLGFTAKTTLEEGLKKYIEYENRINNTLPSD